MAEFHKVLELGPERQRRVSLSLGSHSTLGLLPPCTHSHLFLFRDPFSACVSGSVPPDGNLDSGGTRFRAHSSFRLAILDEEIHGFPVLPRLVSTRSSYFCW